MMTMFFQNKGVQVLCLNFFFRNLKSQTSNSKTIRMAKVQS